MKRNLLIVLAVVILFAVGIFAFGAANNDNDDSSDDSSNETTLTAEDVNQNLGEEDEPEGALVPGGGYEVAVFDSCDIALEFNTDLEAGVSGVIKQVTPSATSPDLIYTITNGFDETDNAATNTLVCRPATIATAVDTYQENLRYNGYSKEDLCSAVGILEEGCEDIDGDIIAFESESEDGLLTEGFSFIAHGKQYEVSSVESDLFPENSWQLQSTVESVASVEFISEPNSDTETILYEY